MIIRGQRHQVLDPAPVEVGVGLDADETESRSQDPRPGAGLRRKTSRARSGFTAGRGGERGRWKRAWPAIARWIGGHEGRTISERPRQGNESASGCRRG